MTSPHFHSLIRMTGPHSFVARVYKVFTDPSGLLNAHYIFPMPTAINESNWENLGRHWQKCYWGFEGFPEVVTTSIDAVPDELSVFDVHLVSVGGHPIPLLEQLAKQFPQIVVQVAWCMDQDSAPKFERHGCTFINGSSASEDAFRHSAKTLDTLAAQLERIWNAGSGISYVNGAPEFIPLPKEVPVDMDKHFRECIAKMLAIPSEIITKELTDAVYNKTVEMVSADEKIRAYVVATTARESARANEATEGSVSGVAEDPTTVLREPERTDSTVDDDVSEYHAPC
jgi:hypothetical protein